MWTFSSFGGRAAVSVGKLALRTAALSGLPQAAFPTCETLGGDKETSEDTA